MSGSGAANAPAVCVVTDRRLVGTRALADVVAACVAGGATMVQVREKDLGGAALLELTRSIVVAARRRTADGATAVRVLVNDRLDVALASGVAGVHLPADGLDIAAAREAGRGRSGWLVGRSVHGLDEARRCEDAGADYLIFGPVFATPSKAAYGPPQGVAALERVVAAVGVPVWAIGGIGAATAGRLRGLPIAGVAVVSAAALAPDPKGAIRSLAAALGATARRRPSEGLSRRESSRR